MDDTTTAEIDRQAAQLGLTALELRALIKPLFFALYNHERTSIILVRHGATVTIEIH